MAERISINIQNFLKWFIPILLIFALFFAFENSREATVVVLPDEKEDTEIIDELSERGYLSNSLSYFVAKVAVKFGFDIESGGFLLYEKMGPIKLLAALASPEYKYVAVAEGLRKEEIAELFAEKLEWTEEQINEFSIPEDICILSGGEGYMFPGKYLVHKDHSVEDVKELMKEKLDEVIKDSDDKVINMNQIMTIASLIQREAAGKHDMELISGIIWNRIFENMPLQIDATLQYAKGDEDTGWWPPVRSEDKFIESPYNTYQIDGLPPGPIANPGIAAINAAMNPDDTNCLFYLHDRNRVIHCASDYETHKRNVRHYLR